MRILYAISNLEQAPAARHLLDLIRGFGHEFEIHFAAGEEGTLTAQARDFGAQCHILPNLDSTSPLGVMRGCGALSDLVARLRPSLVHAHGSRAGLMARLAARRCGVPSVSTPHTWNVALLAPLERLIANDSGRVVCISDENRRDGLRRGIAAGRIAVIRPGVPDSSLRAHPGRGMISEFVMIGPFVTQSHHQLLLEAFAGIDAPCRLTLIGDGEHQAWMRGLSFKLGIAGKVSFLDSRQSTAEVLARASVAAWAGRGAGMPDMIPLALRAGLPVVASDAGLAHEAIAHSENGYLVPPNDIAGFRNALWALAADPRLRARMGEAARVRYEQSFSTTQMLEKTAQLYDAVWAEAGVRREIRHTVAAGGN